MMFNPSDAHWSQQGNSMRGAANALPAHGMKNNSRSTVCEHC